MLQLFYLNNMSRNWRKKEADKGKGKEKGEKQGTE